MSQQTRVNSLQSSRGVKFSDLGRLSMSHEWSLVVSAKVKEEYMTLQGRLQDYSLPHSSEVKSHFKFIELDINASHACFDSFCSVRSSRSHNVPSCSPGLPRALNLHVSIR